MLAILFRQIEGIIFREALENFKQRHENNLMKDKNKPPVLHLIKHILKIAQNHTTFFFFTVV